MLSTLKSSSSEKCKNKQLSFASDDQIATAVAQDLEEGMKSISLPGCVKERDEEEEKEWKRLEDLKIVCGYCGSDSNIKFHRVIPERFGHQVFCNTSPVSATEDTGPNRRPLDCFEKYSRFKYSNGKDLRYGIPYVAKHASQAMRKLYEWKEGEVKRCAYCGEHSETIVKCPHLSTDYLHIKFCANDKCCTSYGRFLKKPIAIPYAFKAEVEEFINPLYYGVKDSDSLLVKVEKLLNQRLKAAQKLNGAGFFNQNDHLFGSSALSEMSTGAAEK